jgi:hypothetical protein
MLAPLSGSEKGNEDLQLIGVWTDGRIGSVEEFEPIYSGR